ncbi:hypothetical protein GALMADRAFT_907822 [Galerina marginata CBS 339.88]|uniref:Uncharacterized protein n=1 Tax=Galerina marginata (strain CBS 339.88) TaxID=685588 RepID=A0A067SFN9_GALM3|nr:hypothetical protein GALMADRAFT_907822 [Galerina marginata CBS 339.88]
MWSAERLRPSLLLTFAGGDKYPKARCALVCVFVRAPIRVAGVGEPKARMKPKQREGVANVRAAAAGSGCSNPPELDFKAGIGGRFKDRRWVGSIFPSSPLASCKLGNNHDGRGRESGSKGSGKGDVWCKVERGSVAVVGVCAVLQPRKFVTSSSFPFPPASRSSRRPQLAHAPSCLPSPHPTPTLALVRLGR